MQVLSKVEVIERFAAFPSRTDEYARCDQSGLFFVHPESSCIDLEYPSKLERLPWLVRLLATIGYQSEDFNGALLWFTEWGVWNYADEGVGYRIVETMHRASGQPRAFESGPGHVFRADELSEATGMLLQPMIFGWDAYYLPRWSYGTDQVFLHVSHDSFVSIVTRTKEFYDKVFRLLEELELRPKAGHKMHTDRFCRVSLK